MNKSRLLVVLAVCAVVTTYFSVADAEPSRPRLIVMGDSLSTSHEGWPNYLREIAPRWNVQVMAQNGRSIRDFSIPRDLWTSGDKNETVVYFLGANDILQCNCIDHARYRLQAQINFLLENNFKVLLVIPPTLGVTDERFTRPMEEHRALIESYRGYHPNLWVYDVDQVWDNEKTYDNIHPNPELSMEIAMAINMVLALNIF